MPSTHRLAPRKDRDKLDYLMGAVIVLALLVLIGYIVVVLATGETHFR